MRPVLKIFSKFDSDQISTSVASGFELAEHLSATPIADFNFIHKCIPKIFSAQVKQGL